MFGSVRPVSGTAASPAFSGLSANFANWCEFATFGARRQARPAYSRHSDDIMNTHIANARTAPKRIRRSKDLLVLTAVTSLTLSIAFGTGFPGFLARDPPQKLGPVDFAHRERNRRRGERTLVESDPRDARGVRLDEFRPGAQDDRWRRLAGGPGLGL
jgi:hypothetical protein